MGRPSEDEETDRHEAHSRLGHDQLHAVSELQQVRVPAGAFEGAHAVLWLALTVVPARQVLVYPVLNVCSCRGGTCEANRYVCQQTDGAFNGAD